jgi:F-type H+-transporting ATPase subunit alpha
MIFLSTKGLLDKVAVSNVRAFEKDFVNVMNATQKSTMEALKEGKFDDSLTDVLTKVSKEIAPKYA